MKKKKIKKTKFAGRSMLHPSHAIYLKNERKSSPIRIVKDGAHRRNASVSVNQGAINQKPPLSSIRIAP